MNEDEMYLPELDDIQPDVVLAAAVDLKLDIKDFVWISLKLGQWSQMKWMLILGESTSLDWCEETHLLVLDMATDL